MSQKQTQAARINALNKYLKKHFGISYRVQGYAAKYLLKYRNDNELKAALEGLKRWMSKTPAAKFHRAGLVEEG